MPGAFLVFDASGKIRAVTPSLCAELGYSENELLDCGIARLVDGERVDSPRLTLRHRSEESKTTTADVAVVGGPSEPIYIATVAEPSTEPYQQIFDLSPLPMWICDRESLRFLAVNDAAIAQYGYSRDEFLSMSILAIRREEDHADLRQLLASSTNVTRNLSAIHVKRDESQTEVELTAFDIEFESRRARLVIVQDVGERHRAEHRLRISEQRYRTLVDLAPDMVMVHHGIIDFVNAAGVKLLGGNSPADIIGRRTIDFVHPDSKELVANRIEQLARDNFVPFVEEKLVTLDGRVVEVETAAVAFEDDGVRKVMLVARDLGERNQAVSRIRETVSLLQSTLESTADGILAVDANGRIIAFNQRFAQMFGGAHEVGHAASAPPLERIAAAVRETETIRSQEEFLATHPDAESFDVLELRDGRVVERYSIPQWLDGRPAGRVWNFRDVTEQRHAELSAKGKETILEAVGFAAERFLMSGDWTEKVSDVLARLGAAADVSRVYVFEFHWVDHRLVSSQRFEWVAEGVKPQIDNPALQNLPFDREFGRWYAMLRSGRTIQGLVRDFPPGEREILVAQDIHAIACVPIAMDHTVWGFIGFDDCISDRHWSPAELEALKTAAEIFGAALQRKKMEAALRSSEARYRRLFERNLAGVYRQTLEGRVLDCNDAYLRIFGCKEREELSARPASEWYWDPLDRDRLLSRLYEHNHASNVEMKMRRVDGSPVFVIENVTLVDGDEEHPVVLEGTLIDITDRKRAEERIAYQAYHDTITSLPNRSLFQDRLTIALAQARRTGRSVAVMFLDLDHFKFVNDTLGHTVGDMLLQEVAARLVACVREEDTVARLGGDEFTLLLMGLDNEQDAAKVAQKILNAIAEPFEVGGHELFVTTSIGIAIYPADGDDAEVLLQNADSAMYRAKDLGRNTYQLCTAAMNAKALERLSIEKSLRLALERQEFLVYYQPQIRVADGTLIGVEALVRWRHPERGIVGPNEFIAIAEDARLIFTLGEYVLREACVQTKRWHDDGWPGLRVSVNLSARQFQQRELLRVVEKTLAETGLPAQCLELEITEGIAMQNTDWTLATLKEMKQMGIRISIDDFGTGHSSLNYLKRFPIDTLKIDRAFVRDIASRSEDAAIVSAVIAMARGLNLRVVAEGVETEAQRDALGAMACEEMQGYLVSRPLPADELDRLLRNQKSESRKQK